MLFQLNEQEKILVESLKESADWLNFIADVEKVVIENIKNMKGQPWYRILLQIVVDVASKCNESGMEAIKGSASIPVEWKNAPASAWVSLAVAFLVDQGTILADTFNPPQNG